MGILPVTKKQLKKDNKEEKVVNKSRSLFMLFIIFVGSMIAIVYGVFVYKHEDNCRCPSSKIKEVRDAAKRGVYIDIDCCGILVR